MRKLILLILIISMLFTSCKKNSSTTDLSVNRQHKVDKI